MEIVKNVNVSSSLNIREKEVMEAYASWKKAIMSNDLSFLANFYSDNFILTTCAGVIKNKSEVLTRLRFKDVEYLTWEDKNITVDSEGDKAVVTSRQTLDIQLYGLPIKIDREITLTFAKGDSWILSNIKENSM